MLVDVKSFKLNLLDMSNDMTFISGDGDGIGKTVGRALLHDDAVEVTKMSQRIAQGNDLFTKWALEKFGNVISAGGDEFCLQVPSDVLGELPDLARQYQEITGATLSVGVGQKISESAKALLYAKINGKNQIVFYTPEVEKAITDLAEQPEADKIKEMYLSKANIDPQAAEKLDIEKEKASEGKESHQKGGASKGFKSHMGTQRKGAFGAPSMAPEAFAQGIKSDPNKAVTDMYASLIEQKQGKVSIDQEGKFHQHAQSAHDKEQAETQEQETSIDELKQYVLSILLKVKEQAPILDQIQQTSPELYESIIQMTKAMILLGREVTGTDISQARPQQSQIQQEPQLMAKGGSHWKEALPVGSQIDTSAQGTRGGGKIKIRTADGKERFVSIRGGKIMGIDGSARSSLAPTSPGDVPPLH